MGTSNGERERLGRQILVKAGDGEDESRRKTIYFFLLGEAFLLLGEAIIWYLARRKEVRLFRFMLSLEDSFTLDMGFLLMVSLVGFILLESETINNCIDRARSEIVEMMFMFCPPIFFCVFSTWIGYEGYRCLLYWSVGSNKGFTFWGNLSASIISIASINLGIIILLFFCIKNWRKKDTVKKLILLILTIIAFVICFLNDREQLKGLNTLSDGEAATIEEFKKDGEDVTVTERIRWKSSDERGSFLRTIKG